MKKQLLICCLAALPLRHLQVNSGYGLRLHPLTGLYKNHAGIDLYARSDTVFSVLPGVISSVSYDAILGIHIRVSSGELVTVFGHLSKPLVLPGDPVEAGRPIAITGATGRVTGEHLHFGVRLGSQPIDPLLFLKQILNHHYE